LTQVMVQKKPDDAQSGLRWGRKTKCDAFADSRGVHREREGERERGGCRRTDSGCGGVGQGTRTSPTKLRQLTLSLPSLCSTAFSLSLILSFSSLSLCLSLSLSLSLDLSRSHTHTHTLTALSLLSGRNLSASLDCLTLYATLIKNKSLVKTKKPRTLQ